MDVQRGRRGLGVVSFLVLLVIAPAGAATAQEEPAPFTPAWYEREAENYAAARGRTTDQLANPAYHQLRAEVCTSGSDPAACNGDAYRRIDAWDGVRGDVREISFANRYGATLRGQLWSPPRGFTDAVTARRRADPFPALIIVSAYGFEHSRYRAFAQGLAEEGYVVLTFDPQGQGASDADGHPRYCDPEGAWREPQEMGIRETGACAGQDPQPEGTTSDLPYLPPIILSGDARGVQELYRAFRPRFVFGALDAATWLLSDDNPWRDRVDETRLGIAGHSLGAYAAMMVANGDPLQRFDAGISWDSFAHLDNGVAPSVPTMFQQSEQENLLGPRTAPPEHPEWLHPARRSHAEFLASCVDTKFLVLRSSTHREWSYFAPGNLTEASRTGERFALHQSLAWFDRYLKGAKTRHVRGDETAQARHASRRLDAAVLDDSADRSSIGTGAWDPSDGNVPYTIAGEPVADHLSYYYDSDTRVQRCTAPAPPSDPPDPPASTQRVGPSLPATGGAGALPGALMLTAGALLARRRAGRLPPAAQYRGR
jgi:dienelactone hydrolase